MSESIFTVETVFNAALMLPSNREREAYIERVCGHDENLANRVKALLDSYHDSTLSPDGWMTSKAGHSNDSIHFEGPGDFLGPYRLVELLGEGGFGSVYRAEQEKPIRRQVALKIIKVGMDTREVIQRFQAESQALALMDHPGIARVFDAGATALGRPFFVMELFQGKPVTTYCDDHHLSVLDRLGLFRKICEAVHHAHQKGVIHRDLKPSNILVGDQIGKPQPKIIDFGIAKATQARLTEESILTQVHHFIGTPAYMSPEQAHSSGLDIDIRSDVYSLGVLLYELLTGTTPLGDLDLSQSGLEGLRRLIVEVEPPRPSTRLSLLKAEQLRMVATARQSDPTRLGSLLGEELDWIVLKALEKDRGRRYQSVSAFADDISRYLNNEPVTALRPGRLYQFRKFVVRNRFWALASTLVFTSLLLGIAVSLWQARRANRMTDMALISAELARDNERLAEMEKGRAVQAEKKTRATLSLADYQAAIRLLDRDQIREAVAHLSRSLRTNPDADAPGRLLLSTLSQGGYMRSPWGFDAVGGPPFRFSSSESGNMAAFSTEEGIGMVDLSSGLPTLRVIPVLQEVLGLAISTDDSLMAFALDDKRVYIEDLRAGTRRSIPLSDAFQSVSRVLFTPDNRYLIVHGGEEESVSTAIHEHPIGVWDTETLEILSEPWPSMAHTGMMKVTPDSRKIIVLPAPQGRFLFPSIEFAVHDLITGQEVLPRLLHDSPIQCMAVSPDGQALVGGTETGQIRVWDLSDGRLMHEFKGHESPVHSIAVHPAGGRVFSLSEDGTANIWELRSGKPLLPAWKAAHVPLIRTPNNPKNLHSKAVMSPDGITVWTATGNLLRGWDMFNGRPICQAVDLEYNIGELSVGLDGLFLIALPMLADGVRGQVQVWPLATPRAMPSTYRQTEALPAQAVDHDGRIAATAFSDRTVRVWHLSDGRELLPPLQHPVSVNRLAIHTESDTLATVADRKLYLWDLKDGALRAGGLESEMPVIELFFSTDGSRVVTSETTMVDLRTSSRLWRVWNTRSGEMLGSYSIDPANLQLNANVPPAVVFNRACDQVAVSGSGKTWIQDLSDSSSRRRYLGSDHVADQMHFDADGKRLLTLSRLDSKLRVWDVETGSLVVELKGSPGGIRQVKFAGAADKIAAWSDQGAIRIWDVGTPDPVAEIIKIGADSAMTAFDTSGNRLLTVSADHDSMSSQVWDISSGFPISPRIDSAYVFFSSGGSYLIRSNPSITWVEVPPLDEAIPEWVAGFAEQWCGLAFDANGLLKLVPRSFESEPFLNLAEESGSDYLKAWTAWMLDSPLSRRISPLSEQSVADYVAALDHETGRPALGTDLTDHFHIDIRSDPSMKLREALYSHPLNPDAMARFGFMLGNHPDPLSQLEADWYSRKGLELAPGQPAPALWRSKYLLEQNRPDEVLSVLKKGDLPSHALFDELRGRAHSHLGNHEEADKAYTRALDHEAEPWDLSGSGKLRFLRQRSAVRLRLNRPSEAREDWLLAHRIPKRDLQTDPDMLDLTDYYNESLDGNWIHQLDPEETSRQEDLPEHGHNPGFLPLGVNPLGEVSFDVRGAVVLSGGLTNTWLESKYPARVNGILLNRKAARLHFLYSAAATARVGGLPDAGWIRIRYTDQTMDEVSLPYSRGLFDLIHQGIFNFALSRLEIPENQPGPGIAAIGVNPAGMVTSLFHEIWKNPNPQKEIESLDFVSSGKSVSPILFAITSESIDDRVSSLLEQDRLESILEALKTDSAAVEAWIQNRFQKREPAASVWIASGSLAMEQGRFAEAREDYTRVIESKEDTYADWIPKAFKLRSEANLKLGFEAQAAEDRYLSLNLPRRDPHATPQQIDLSRFYNASTMEAWMSSIPENTLEGLAPLGLKELGGVVFDVRGIIQLTNNQPENLGSYPEKVTGISIGLSCSRLHFLHAAGWGMERTGHEIGHYLIHFEDGATERVDLRIGHEMRDWWGFMGPRPPETLNAKIVWTGENKATRMRGRVVQLFMTTWRNPKPDIPISHMDFVSALNRPAPFLVAVTAE